MSEQQSLRRQLPSKKTMLLLLVIAVLAGIVIVQQVQISYPTPVALQKTPQAWMKFATVLDASYVGTANGPYSEAPSLIVVPLDMGNSTCMSIDRSCGGYDYYFPIENVCQNSTYYGSCNFVGYSVYWYDITKNVLLVTGLDNISIPQGQTVIFHGDWANNVFLFDNPNSTSKALATIGSGDLMFLEVSTSGGWWSAATSIS